MKNEEVIQELISAISLLKNVSPAVIINLVCQLRDINTDALTSEQETILKGHLTTIKM